MASDEIAYNSYFHILQEKFRGKYEEARENSWLICIPSSEALRGVEINQNFVELHILHPILECGKPSCYTSTDEQHSLVYELERDRLNLLAMDLRNADSYTVNILVEELGYNTKLQQYKLLLVDKLLSPHISASDGEEEERWLNNNISTLTQAQQLLLTSACHACVLEQLDLSVATLTRDMSQAMHLDLACDLLRQTVCSLWTCFLTTHPLHRQRDAKFQLILSTALETYIASCVHEQLFSLTCSTFSQEDSEVHRLTTELSRLGISPDQLGAPEDFAVPLPAAVVELAALDTLSCPIEKLVCLRSCLDLILAQVKAALVDVQSLSANEEEEEGGGIVPVAADDLVPLLMAVLIHAKPLHLVSNLHYMEHCQWSLAPNNELSYSLGRFRAALTQLLRVKVDELRPRSSKLHRELTLTDLILVTDQVEHPSSKVTSPLDRHLESVTAMIEASTRESHHQACSD